MSFVAWVSGETGYKRLRKRESRANVRTAERNRCDSKDILRAFVFGSRIAQNCALSQLFLCIHNPDHLLHNYFSIFLRFFPPNAPQFFSIMINQVIWPGPGTLWPWAPWMAWWGWVFLEWTRILSGIQFTMYFIKKFIVKTKRFVSSFVNVILTRQTCGQRSSRAAESKRRAIENYFSKRICYMFLISKCRGDRDLGLCTTWVSPPLWIMLNYWRAGPSKMPLRSWYNCCTNHCRQADFFLAEMKKPTVLSNKCSNAWSCAKDFVGFLRLKFSEQDFQYLNWTISKIISWNVYLEGNIHDWLGRSDFVWRTAAR